MSALNSSVTTDGARRFQWEKVLGYFRASPYVWGLQYCELCDHLVDIVLLNGVKYMSFFDRHSPTMNLLKEKQRGLILQGLQRWSLQLIEHLTNTISVAPPPACPVGCRPLYLLHLLYSFTIWAPKGAAYSSLGCTKVFYAFSLVLLGAKAKFLRRKP